MRQERPDRWIGPFIKQFLPEERGDWTDKELRHLIKGYAYAVDAADVRQNERKEAIRWLVKRTYRGKWSSAVSDHFLGFREILEKKLLPWKERLASVLGWLAGTPAVVSNTLDGIAERKDAFDGLFSPWTNRIYVRAREPAYLGFVAAHEGAHSMQHEENKFVQEKGEDVPTEMQLTYLLRNPLRGTVSKKSLRKLEKLVKKARAKYPPKTLRIAVKATIIAGVANSIGARLGEKKADVFLCRVREGVHPYEAYLNTVRGQDKAKRRTEGSF